MSDVSREDREQRVLVLAPTGKDAALTGSILDRAGVAYACCPDLVKVCEELKAGAAAVLLPEEAVVAGNEHLTRWLSRQPPWSDLPVLILARPGADRRHVPGGRSRGNRNDPRPGRPLGPGRLARLRRAGSGSRG